MWYPFRSKQVKLICAHLTDDERRQIVDRSGDFGTRYGRAVGAVVAVPGGVMVAAAYQMGWSWEVQAIIFVVWAAAGSLLLRWVYRDELAENAGWTRQFLCNTQWARAQGFSADTLKLYAWPWRRGN